MTLYKQAGRAPVPEIGEPSLALVVGGEAVAPGERPRGTTDEAVGASVRPRWALWIASVAVAAIHALMLRAWLVDDAGITLAFARNLSRGAGLVSQPGLPPVEGFSNPLWTLLLAPSFALGGFDAVWVSKILAFVLLSGTLALVVVGTSGVGVPPWMAGSAALFLALDSSFVIWAVSGLENPLLAFLVAVSATLALRSARQPDSRIDVMAGVVAGLLALTRPDAVLYAAAYPVVIAFDRRGPTLATLRARLGPYVVAFGLVFGSYLAFRRAYFGDWVPNTFHAKMTTRMLDASPVRAYELVRSAVGRAAWPVLAGVAAMIVAARRDRDRARRLIVLGAYLLLAVAAYFLLPPDWMGEHRFATGFFLLFYWVVGDLLAWLWLQTEHSVARGLVATGAVILLLGSIWIHGKRTSDFARHPTVPFEEVREQARRYNRLAEALAGC